MEDKLAFIGAAEAVEEPVVATETPEPAQEAPVVEAAPMEAQPEASAQVVEPKAEAPMVPLSALLEVRDEVKSLKSQLVERPQPAPVYVPAPDPIAEPEAAYEWAQQQTNNQIYQTNMHWSKRIAEIQHGPELVKQALDWGVQRCAADQYFNQRLLASQDPVGEAISEFQRSSIDPSQWAQFQSWQQAQSQIQQAPQQAAPIKPQAPVSIASAPSAGGGGQAIPVGPGHAFDGLFTKG